MKKTLKATISVAVAAIVSLSCLAVTACGGGDDFGSQEYEAFDPDKQYQLDFLGWGSVAELSIHDKSIHERQPER